MPDFLLELRSEEIPARMQDRARDDFARLFTAELAKAGLRAAALETYATPRRLALIARDLPDATEAVSEEVKGPRASAPPQALEGFLRKTGLTQDQLTERDGVLFAVTEKPGRPTAVVLADAIPAIVRAFPWPKSMRWGAASASTESPRWVRPLHGIVALLGEEIVPVEVAGITSGAATLGHRFHHPGPITLGGAHDYVEKLRACHVIVDQDERRRIIREGATRLAADAGLELVEDEGLVMENAGLTEWPVPLLGRFDKAFLQVPPEVIQLTARVNQKYFVCRSGEGRLANAFICTANIDAIDGGAKIVEGNRKVLAARLADARFFYEQDLKVPLEQQAEKLGNIVFHEKLGTVADKVDRVAKLARWLVEEGIISPSPFRGEGQASEARQGEGTQLADEPPGPSPASLRSAPASGKPPPGRSRSGRGPDRPDAPLEGEGREDLAALAERAARLCKADLVTGMVGEFPELQGLMGGYYAAAQGEHPAVAAAIRDHYKPVGQGDEVPTAPVTVAVSLADKLDTIAQFHEIGEISSGSRDPFALRRAAIGVISLVRENGLRFDVATALGYSISVRLTTNEAVSSSRAVEDVIMAALSLNNFNVIAGVVATTLKAKFTSEYAEVEASDEQMLSILRPAADARDFILTRLEQGARDAGVRVEYIRACRKNVLTGVVDSDLVRLLARVRALQAFVGTEDGANLLAGYKRAANILKKEGYVGPSTPRHPGLDPGSRFSIDDSEEAGPRLEGRGDEVEGAPPKPLSYTPEIAETALVAALESAEPAAAQAVAAEDFEGAMAALATLRAPIDAFFDTVTVNDPDPAKREARLALLARVRDAVHTVADFSRIEG